MTRLIYGFAPSQAIAVAAKLGLADLLQEEPQSAEELATITKTHAQSLRRLLRMLTNVGVFAEERMRLLCLYEKYGVDKILERVLSRLEPQERLLSSSSYVRL